MKQQTIITKRSDCSAPKDQQKKTTSTPPLSSPSPLSPLSSLSSTLPSAVPNDNKNMRKTNDESVKNKTNGKINEKNDEKKKEENKKDEKKSDKKQNINIDQNVDDNEDDDIIGGDKKRGEEEIKKISEGIETKQKKVYDVKVAVVGNVDSGKSTLIGVLTGGELDNGRGSARTRIFVHRHELANGRTSCISQHIMGFDEKNNVIHQPVAASASSAQKTKSWKAVVEKSRSLVTFIDLAGHERYLKTTIAGLTGSFPDYAVVIINSLAGISKMTKEHLGVILALEIPFACIVTKVDMCPDNVLIRTKSQLFRILKSPHAKKLPIAVRDEKDVSTCLENESNRICPVFFVSSVSGKNLELLSSWLSQLKPRRDYAKRKESPTEFNIDETFNVTGVGIVISGTVASGVMVENSVLLLGPANDGTFREVLIRSIHCKRVPVDRCDAGDSCAVSLRSVRRREPLKRSSIRRGMVLVDPSAKPVAHRVFESEVLVLHHPTTIKMSYQAVIHCGIIRQTAAIDKISKECLRTGDKAIVRFRFMMRPEYLHTGAVFIFREGNTKGIGRITTVDESAMVLKDTPEDLQRKEEERKEAEMKETKNKEEKKKEAEVSGVVGDAVVNEEGEELGTDKRERNRHKGGKDKAKEKEKEKEKALKSKEKETGGHKEKKEKDKTKQPDIIKDSPTKDKEKDTKTNRRKKE